MSNLYAGPYRQRWRWEHICSVCSSPFLLSTKLTGDETTKQSVSCLNSVTWQMFKKHEMPNKRTSKYQLIVSVSVSYWYNIGVIIDVVYFHGVSLKRWHLLLPVDCKDPFRFFLRVKTWRTNPDLWDRPYLFIYLFICQGQQYSRHSNKLNNKLLICCL